MFCHLVTRSHDERLDVVCRYFLKICSCRFNSWTTHVVGRSTDDCAMALTVEADFNDQMGSDAFILARGMLTPEEAITAEKM
jgi:hypothetical protein